MKAFRRKDGGIQLFRPQENALRLQMGAERLLMEAPTVEQYVDAVKQVVVANKRWVMLQFIIFFCKKYLFVKMNVGIKLGVEINYA